VFRVVEGRRGAWGSWEVVEPHGRGRAASLTADCGTVAFDVNLNFYLFFLFNYVATAALSITPTCRRIPVVPRHRIPVARCHRAGGGHPWRRFWAAQLREQGVRRAAIRPGSPAVWHAGPALGALGHADAGRWALACAHACGGVEGDF
jgi:hypothetical protein